MVGDTGQEGIRQVVPRDNIVAARAVLEYPTILFVPCLGHSHALSGDKPSFPNSKVYCATSNFKFPKLTTLSVCPIRNSGTMKVERWGWIIASPSVGDTVHSLLSFLPLTYST